MFMFFAIVIVSFHLIATGFGIVVIFKIIIAHFEDQSTEEISNLFDLGWKSTTLVTIITWFLIGMSMGGYSSLFSKAAERF
jgi:peptidoglycan biosynthesis protein MviN/MurJ (putative lipid II flippase)